MENIIVNIFDLNIHHPYKKYDLQNNLKNLKQKYNGDFFIKYEINKKTIRLKVNLIEKLLPNNKKFYRLYYVCPDRTTKLNNLMIDFIDIITNELNNNSYINDIHKLDNISGTELLLICLKICEILGVQKTNLIDISSIKINNLECSLSFIKLLETKQTFYMKYGFDYEISLTQLPYIRYENKDLLKLKISNLIDSIRKIKIKDIIKDYEISLKIIENINDLNKLKIMIDNSSNPMENIEICESKDYTDIDQLVIESYEMINLLNKYNDVSYLYELFIMLFKKSSDDYLILHKYFIENKRTKLIHLDKIVQREYIFDINVLILLMNSYYYSYVFY